MDVPFSDIMKKYEYGLTILNDLFKMSIPEFKEKLLSILNSTYDEIVKNGRVEKITSNDIPECINIYFYDKITISPFGIDYKPEHGESRNLISFNQHFKL